jgi:uncharacterized membrane protein YccC
MNLSRRAKESIKTALAMTIAYGIALAMDWDKPYWAGFAVAFTSLATIGLSLNKAALRVVGTLVGTAAALFLIAHFAQDRWPFVLSLSAWIFFCTYMMGGVKHPYFWHVSGFVCVVVAMGAGPDPVHAFQIAILRSQETGLGIVVYSLVALLLWPVSSRSGFEDSVGKLAASQTRLYQAYLALLHGKGDAEEAQSLRAQLVQDQSRFNELLAAAESDTYEVRELRPAWRRYQALVTDLDETLERWRESFADLQTLDLDQLVPGLDDFGQEIGQRLSHIEDMLAGQAPGHRPETIELAVNRQAIRALPHFHRAAMVVSRKRLHHIESLTRSLFDVVCELRDYVQPDAEHDTPAASSRPLRFLPDPDRTAAAIRVVLILWCVWLTVIYINDIPGGTGLISMAVPIGMILATTPQLSLPMLFTPIMNSVLFAAVIYIFVMPKLSGFTELGPLIFITTFIICYLYAAPRKMLGRAFGLAMFLAIAGISNHQTYSFLAVANTALMFPIIFTVFALTAHIPFSSRPERVILRLLGRFFRSGDYLMSSMERDAGKSAAWLAEWKQAFHSRELATLPQKMTAFARLIDTRDPAGSTSGEVLPLVNRLQALSYRMEELLETRDSLPPEQLVENLLTDFRDWHLGLQKTLQQLALDPGAVDQTAFRHGLDSAMQRLETRTHESLDGLSGDQISVQDRERFYSLLGTYRGVSEALVEYAGSAGSIDWERWREERFA